MRQSLEEEALSVEHITSVLQPVGIPVPWAQSDVGAVRLDW